MYFKDKVVVVTGAGAEIGRSTALTFAESYADQVQDSELIQEVIVVFVL